MPISPSDLKDIAKAIQTHPCFGRSSIRWVVLTIAIVIFVLYVSTISSSRPTCVYGDTGESSITININKGLPAQIVVLNEDPCVRLIENFLDSTEAKHIIEKYKSTLARSTVTSAEKEETVSSRTSSSSFLPAGSEDGVIAAIESRLLLITGIPIPYWETLQLTHYVEDQEYKPHHDWFDQNSREHDNNRTCTVFCYLNDVPEAAEGMTEFTKLGLKVQPKLGRAVIWFNCRVDGKGIFCEPMTEHAGRPPKYGEKFGLNCWARTSKYR